MSKKLPKRLIEIMNLIKLGQANKQIALTLQINEQTVKNYISDIFRILGAHDRAHAIYLCLKGGIIEYERD